MHDFLSSPSSSGTMVKVDFMEVCVARISRLFWETACFLRRSGGSIGTDSAGCARGIGTPLASEFRREGEVLPYYGHSVQHPQSDLVQFRGLIFPKGDRLTAAEELFRDYGGVQVSCSRLSRSAEFCSAFPQCLHVAPRVSIPWDRSLLLRAQIARAVLDQPFRQRDCVPLFGN